MFISGSNTKSRGWGRENINPKGGGGGGGGNDMSKVAKANFNVGGEANQVPSAPHPSHEINPDLAHHMHYRLNASLGTLNDR